MRVSALCTAVAVPAGCAPAVSKEELEDCCEGVSAPRSLPPCSFMSCSFSPTPVLPAVLNSMVLLPVSMRAPPLLPLLWVEADWLIWRDVEVEVEAGGVKKETADSDLVAVLKLVASLTSPLPSMPSPPLASVSFASHASLRALPLPESLPPSSPLLCAAAALALLFTSTCASRCRALPAPSAAAGPVKLLVAT